MPPTVDCFGIPLTPGSADLIPSNPADKVDRPRKNAFTASFYSKEEFARLFSAVEGSLIEMPVKLSAFYGLRRSEVLGLKWNAIDFDRNTISIRHTVTSCTVDAAAASAFCWCITSRSSK